MSWKDTIRKESTRDMQRRDDEDWESHVSQRREAQSEADMGNYTGAEYEDEFSGDELAAIVFGELGGIVTRLEREIDPQRDQRNNPSKKVMDNIKALVELYGRLTKIGNKRYR